MHDPMPADLARRLVAAAQHGAPNEICGFIMADWEWVPVLNVSPHPTRSFQMDEDDLVRILLHEADNVLGVYHSHPGGRKEPSDTDILGWNYPWMRYWIVTYGDVYEWRIKSDSAKPVRRDGTTGIADMAYPVLAPTEAVRRTG